MSLSECVAEPLFSGFGWDGAGHHPIKKMSCKEQMMLPSSATVPYISDSQHKIERLIVSDDKAEVQELARDRGVRTLVNRRRSNESVS